MQYIIHGYEPKKFFEHFEEISAIPRGSGNEKGISDFLVEFGKSLGLETYQDELYNVILKKPASKGCESSPAVMLQGHIDMVCEKNADVEHDFLKDGIKLIVENGRLRADGTTLGGDNGIAVALMMTILEDDSLVHPALECVFTAQEEVGLVGAKHLDGSQLKARRLINMDSGGEGEATVSCAGGLRVDLRHPCEFSAADNKALHISVRGLAGGHSGAEIHLGHGNSNKIMARILYALLEKIPGLRLCGIDGGSKDNAIPRECDSTVALPADADFDQAIAIVEAEASDIAAELSMTEKSFFVNVSPAEAEKAMAEDVTREIIELLYLAPNGVRSRNPAMGDFVVSSLNLGVIRTENDAIVITFSPRSSVASLQNQTKKELSLLARLFGCKIEMRSEYPGWGYAESSALRDVFSEAYRDLTGKEMVFHAIHAGLECGLLVDKLPGLDVIAVGAGGGDCHTPSEWLDMASIPRFYDLIKLVLKKLAE